MSDETHIPIWMIQAAGGILFVFGLGKVFGTLLKNDKDQTKEIEQLKFDLKAAIKERDIDISDLRALFVTDNGDPRFITYGAHDTMQNHCQALISNDIAHIKETLEDIKLTVNRRHSSRREDDET